MKDQSADTTKSNLVKQWIVLDYRNPPQHGWQLIKGSKLHSLQTTQWVGAYVTFPGDSVGLNAWLLSVSSGHLVWSHSLLCSLGSLWVPLGPCLLLTDGGDECQESGVWVWSVSGPSLGYLSCLLCLRSFLKWWNVLISEEIGIQHLS